MIDIFVFNKAGEYRERLDSVIIELNDLADEAERRAESVEYNAGRIEKINQRLNTIYDLLFKYKAESVEELVTLREQIREKLKKVEGGSEEIEHVSHDSWDLHRLCCPVSRVRRKKKAVEAI